MTPAPMRLNRNDNIFVVMDQVLGTPVTSLFQWEIDVSFDAKHFASIGSHLQLGRLSRKLVRPRMGRDYWVRDASSGRVIIQNEPIEDGGFGTIDDWTRALLAHNPVDAGRGYSWVFAAAPTRVGHTAVVLACSHAVADGSAIFAALAEALAGAPVALPESSPVSALDNFRDQGVLFKQAAVAVKKLWQLTRDRTPAADEGVQEDPLEVEAANPAASAKRRVVAATFVVPVQDFAARAKEAQGTPNSLFVAVVARVAQKLGTIPATRGPHPVAVPMGLRNDPMDLQANVAQGATVRTEVSAEVYEDLRGVRAALKQAYGQLSDAEGPADLTFELAQAVPDFLVKQLSKGNNPPPVLASNLGVIAPDIACLGMNESAKNSRLAVRTTEPVNADLLDENRQASTNAWATATGDSIALCFVAPEPVEHSTEGAIAPEAGGYSLAGAIAAELQAWGLPAARWY